MKELIFPKPNGQPGQEQFDVPGNIVLLGANGAGKTRFSIWVETHQEGPVHRISAQKALGIPDVASLKNLEKAEKSLFLGRDDEHASQHRKHIDRWGNNPASHLLSDYEQLLSLLFAKQTERNEQYVAASKLKGTYQDVPSSPIDQIETIWREVLPHREITFKDSKVMVRASGSIGNPYHGKEMSDGERVVLYFLGQCLCAPANSLVIVDEPEIHLHKAIVDKLWNKIEEVCPKIRLFYITHDLDFAASRGDATKVWIKKYNADLWEWAVIPALGDLPEKLVLEIAGSRKEILFCEGEAGSLDSTIYRIVYPEFHIVPRGSCEKVIEATKALGSTKMLHYTNCRGLIDTDYRDQTEIDALRKHNIFVLPVAEIENVVCTKAVLRVVAKQLLLNPDAVEQKVTSFIANAMQGEFATQISSLAERKVQYLLGAFSKTSNDKAGIAGALKNTLSAINVDKIYSDCEKIFSKALNSNDLDEMLKVYNRKSLADRISNVFGQSPGEYIKLVVRLLKSDQKGDIVNALRTMIPTLA